MNLYLDASALVKEYLTDELGTEEVVKVRREAELVGTTTVSRAETEAALKKAARTGTLTEREARSAREDFGEDWPDLIRLQVTEALVARAGELAFKQDLRGYDAVQLASALAWTDGIEEAVTFATFDRQLWDAASAYSLLIPFPEDLPALLEEWA
ncbi:MAG: type II toxin-antitoxin system VapC family toxin [Salinibacter sp.]